MAKQTRGEATWAWLTRINTAWSLTAKVVSAVIVLGSGMAAYISFAIIGKLLFSVSVGIVICALALAIQVMVVRRATGTGLHPALGAFWDNDLNPYCLSCKKPLKPSSRNPTIFHCSDPKCDSKHPLRDDSGRALTKYEARKLIASNFRPELQQPVDADREFFVGQWTLGCNAASPETFTVRLKSDGTAERDRPSGDDRGTVNGTWEYVHGEARAVWDDGWVDVLRCIPGGVLKLAFEKPASDPHHGLDNTAKATKVSEA